MTIQLNSIQKGGGKKKTIDFSLQMVKRKKQQPQKEIRVSSMTQKGLVEIDRFRTKKLREHT